MFGSLTSGLGCPNTVGYPSPAQHFGGRTSQSFVRLSRSNRKTETHCNAAAQKDSTTRTPVLGFSRRSLLATLPGLALMSLQLGAIAAPTQTAGARASELAEAIQRTKERNRVVQQELKETKAQLDAALAAVTEMENHILDAADKLPLVATLSAEVLKAQRSFEDQAQVLSQLGLDGPELSAAQDRLEQTQKRVTGLTAELERVWGTTKVNIKNLTADVVLNGKSEELEAAMAQVAELKAMLEQSRSELARAQAAYSANLETFDKTSRDLAISRSELTSAKAQLAKLEETVQKASTDSSNVQQTVAQVNAELTQLKNQLQKAAEEKDAAVKAKDALVKEKDILVKEKDAAVKAKDDAMKAAVAASNEKDSALKQASQAVADKEAALKAMQQAQAAAVEAERAAVQAGARPLATNFRSALETNAKYKLPGTKDLFVDTNMLVGAAVVLGVSGTVGLLAVTKDPRITEAERLAEEAQKQVEKEQDTIRELQKKLSEMQSRMDEEQVTVDVLDQTRSDMRDAMSRSRNLSQELKEARRRANYFEEEAKAYKRQVMSLQAELNKPRPSEDNQRVLDLQQEVQATKKRNEALQVELAETKRQLDKALVTIQELQMELKAANIKVSKVDTVRADLERANQRLVEQSRRAESSSDRSSERLAAAQAQVAQLTDQLDKVRSNTKEEMRRLEMDLATKKGDLLAAQRELDDLRMQLKRTGSSSADMERAAGQLAQTRNELNFTRQELDRMRGLLHQANDDVSKAWMEAAKQKEFAEKLRAEVNISRRY